MKITIFTHAEDVQGFRTMISSLSATHPTRTDTHFYVTYDDFIKGFPHDAAQAVIVARRGADGMECARNAKLLRPAVPLVWLSDDAGFGIESYRIGCAFFSAEAVTETVLSAALSRCVYATNENLEETT